VSCRYLECFSYLVLAVNGGSLVPLGLAASPYMEEWFVTVME
jgi:hypothetical protein